MKHSTILYIFISLCQISFSKEKYSCEYPRQTGKLLIIKNDSLKRIDFITKKTKFYFLSNPLAPFPPASNDIKLACLLFTNGLLTPDLIKQAYVFGKHSKKVKKLQIL